MTMRRPFFLHRRWRALPLAVMLSACLPGFLRADLRDKILEQIGTSHSSIDVLVYEIDNVRIADALIEAARQGVRVRIITDGVRSESPSAQDQFLEDSGIPLKRISDWRRDLMHDKFVIFDHRVAATCSYNAPRRRHADAEEEDPFTHDKASLEQFQSEFDQIWNSAAQPGRLSGPPPTE